MSQQFSPFQEESRGVPLPSDVIEEKSKKRHTLRQKAVMLPFRVNLIVLAMTEMGIGLEDFFEQNGQTSLAALLDRLSLIFLFANGIPLLWLMWQIILLVRKGHLKSSRLLGWTGLGFVCSLVLVILLTLLPDQNATVATLGIMSTTIGAECLIAFLFTLLSLPLLRLLHLLAPLRRRRGKRPPP